MYTWTVHLSIKFESFSGSCKITKLKPLFKKGSKANPSNYRLIPVLVLISKIIDKFIHYLRMVFYATINQDFEKTTRQTHASRFCMIKFEGFWKALMTGIILIDLQKAFDMIDHDIILKKLSAIGFSNHTIGWFKSHLSNQLFRVNLENCYSDPSNITSGVPQVFILGPLLFLIYVNDMPKLLNQICFYTVMTFALFFRERILQKLKNN